MRILWTTLFLLAELLGEMAFADTIDTRHASPPSQGRTINNEIDHSSPPIRSLSREPDRSLSVLPLLKCETKDNRFSLQFGGREGYAAADLYENGQKQGALKCSTPKKIDSLYSIECKSETESGFVARFSYSTKLTVGELSEMHQGYANNTSSRLICKD